ncbi:Outer membrane protein assembly factor BamD [subsurface metagenome]
MRNFTPALLSVQVLLLALSLLASCSSFSKNFEQGLTPAEFFQRAQEASEKRNYKLALHYYQAFQAEYPTELDRNLWACYEIAFLYHKMGKEGTALELFEELIEQYASDESAAYPQGPLILAEKVKAGIEDRLQKK